MANKKDEIIEEQKASSKEVTKEEPKASIENKPSGVIYSLSGVQKPNQNKAIHSL